MAVTFEKAVKDMITMRNTVSKRRNTGLSKFRIIMENSPDRNSQARI